MVYLDLEELSHHTDVDGDEDVPLGLVILKYEGAGVEPRVNPSRVLAGLGVPHLFSEELDIL